MSSRTVRPVPWAWLPSRVTRISPPQTAETVGDTIFHEDTSGDVETLAEMCVRQSNTSVYPEVKDKYIAY